MACVSDECRENKRKAYLTDTAKTQRRASYHRNKSKHVPQKSRAYISTTEYFTRLEEQGGRCVICDEYESSGRRLAVDHDHDTGEFRGLICGRCNTGLGLFRDNPSIMNRAIEYIINSGNM